MSAVPDTPARSAHDGPVPLSFSQERIFLLDRLTPGLPVYNVPTLVRVRATLDAAALGRALDRIVERHEALRTRLLLAGGELVQQVAPPRPVELEVADLRGRETPEAEAERLLAEIAQRPFDLSRDTLLRAALVHVADADDRLLVVLHHAGSDHASSALLFGELDTLYGAFVAGTEPELPELPLQYSDFATWQRERLTGELLEHLLAYWRGRLSGAPTRLDLPSDRPRPARQSHRGARRDVELPAPLVTQLRKVARAERASLFVVLLAAFDALLQRYAGVDDLVVGVPVSGRHHAETQALIGYFSNTLALRADLSGDPTFAELVRRVRASMLEAQAHQELPFERLVAELNPERALDRTPLFQVLLGFDVAADSPRTLAGAPVEPLPLAGWSWSRFDLTLVLREQADGSLHGSLEYATDLFDADTIDRLAGHLQTLLDAAAREPALPISALPLLTAAERRQLESWNATERPFPRRCLHELVFEQSRRTPDAVAVAGDDERLTYRELAARAAALAYELRAVGVGPGERVGIVVERSPDLLVAMLAALAAGAAYVPLEPSHPPERLGFVLADAGVRAVVAQEELLAGIETGGAAVVPVETARQGRDDPPAVEVDPEQPAYVVYTSGSSGRPKGVEVPHRAVANLLAHMRREPGLTADGVVANVTTPAFDLSVPDWWLPLTTGARLVVVPAEAALDPLELGSRLAATHATFVQATPTTWQMLVDGGWSGHRELTVVCGGEELPASLAAELLLRAGAVWHAYGPTETTVWSSLRKLEPGDERPWLGGPIANTRFSVLDAHGRPQPVGLPGELEIGGEGVAHGYLGPAELTEERFRPDPSRPGRLAFRTGDLVSRRADGTLRFHGRLDVQVKLRGFRIELGEIESVLAEQPGVAAAACALREDAAGDPGLVAYVVPVSGAAPAPEALGRRLRRLLPEYMLPSSLVVVDSLPAGPTGKLDRGALPPPDGLRGERERPYEPPRTPIEDELAAICGGLLDVDRVGMEDDFFELGGHSLLAVKLLARARDALGVELSLPLLFERRTLRALAEAVTAALLEETDDAAALLADAAASER